MGSNLPLTQSLPKFAANVLMKYTKPHLAMQFFPSVS